MSHQIIKQPNGKYAVFSSIIDGFILLDATREQIIEDRLEQEREHITEKVTEICAKLDAGEEPYYQFTMSWSEARHEHESNHGKKDRLQRFET